MLGFIEKFTASDIYPHEYEKQTVVVYDDGFKKTKQIGNFNVKKKEIHLYDIVIFIIITVFMLSFAYIVIGQMKGAKGYIACCVSLLVIFALLY